MSSTFDALERLSALHKSGVLTDEEFAAEKAKLLNGKPGGPSSTASGTAPAPASAEKLATLNPAWRKRFAFFEQYGSPYKLGGAKALREMPFWTRLSISFNIWAFVFGPLYFPVLGLWKRAASLLVLEVIVLVVAEQLGGEVATRAAGFGVNAIFAATVNYYYFVKLTQGRDEWNPLTDLTSR